MKKLLLIITVGACFCTSKNSNRIKDTIQQHSNHTEIIRDNWGIPHIYGQTDADAVFGLVYSQCEESFERVERNYIQKLGRLSEIEGENYLYEDLLTRLIYDTSAAIKDYQMSPPWLKELLHAFADGVNYYISKNPQNKPRLLTHFEPWYPLLFTDGGLTATQTGGATIADLKSMYFPNSNSTSGTPPRYQDVNMDGSNGFAIGPSKSANGNALLYINPHVSFYFRTESHMVSKQGLNAYGAITWGQFFVFQGFNEDCGWMHTSSLADASDLYEEQILDQNNQLYYRYNDTLRKVESRNHRFHVKTNNGLNEVSVTAYYTHHGPIVGKRNGKWLSLKENNRSINGLMQSWLRMKATDYDSFKKTMELRGNNSCNTMYADRHGTIAYWHGNFIPVRNSKFDYSKPIDGSIGNTEWTGIHTVDELVQFKNPEKGWIQNCNSSPFFGVDGHNLVQSNYPSYMAPDGENFRSVRAIELLRKGDTFSVEDLINIGYDRHLALFDSLLPPLFHSYEALSTSDSLYELLKEPVAYLKAWDRTSSIHSIPTTIATEWAYKILHLNFTKLGNEPEGTDQVKLFTDFIRDTPPRTQLQLLRDLTRDMERIYGTWKIEWGQVVRFQRIAGTFDTKFDDQKESIPVGLASSLFGSLPAFEGTWTDQYRAYGVAGNSFVAAIEFGEKIKAKSLLTAGQSFDPQSKHFNDQANMFIEGKFKEVHFYKEQVKKNAVKTYHP